MAAAVCVAPVMTLGLELVEHVSCILAGLVLLASLLLEELLIGVLDIVPLVVLVVEETSESSAKAG